MSKTGDDGDEGRQGDGDEGRQDGDEGRQNDGDEGRQDDGDEGRQDDGDEGDFDALPAATRKEIRKLRRAEQRLRRERDAAGVAARNDLLAEIGKLLGSGDEELTPEQMRKQISDSQSASRGAQVELAVYRSAARSGADADALLDSRSFMRRVEQMDYSSETFAKDLAQEIKDAVAENPKLGVGKSVGKSGGNSGDKSGGNSGDGGDDGWAEAAARVKKSRGIFS